MIRMKKDAVEASAEVVALLEHSHYDDGSTDGQECAATAIAIALAWMDGAEGWEGWKFVRGGEL